MEHEAVLVCQTKQPEVADLLNEFNDGFSYMVADDLMAALGSTWEFPENATPPELEPASSNAGYWCFHLFGDEIVLELISAIGQAKTLTMWAAVRNEYSENHLLTVADNALTHHQHSSEDDGLPPAAEWLATVPNAVIDPLKVFLGA